MNTKHLSILCVFGQKFYSFMLCCNGILFWRKHVAKCVCSGIEAITIFLDKNMKIPYLCSMTQFTVSIADNKVGIFLEFMKNLAFVKTVEKVEDFTISEEHKNIVRERVKESNKNPELLLNWDDIKEDFILD